jgi:hypothetical protein
VIWCDVPMKWLACCARPAVARAGVQRRAHSAPDQQAITPPSPQTELGEPPRLDCLSEKALPERSNPGAESPRNQKFESAMVPISDCELTELAQPSCVLERALPNVMGPDRAEHISGALDARDLARAAAVCRLWRQLVAGDVL